eukprot:3801620-Rhodomonas_salina.1
MEARIEARTPPRTHTPQPFGFTLCGAMRANRMDLVCAVAGAKVDEDVGQEAAVEDEVKVPHPSLQAERSSKGNDQARGGTEGMGEGREGREKEREKERPSSAANNASWKTSKQHVGKNHLRACDPSLLPSQIIHPHLLPAVVAAPCRRAGCMGTFVRTSVSTMMQLSAHIVACCVHLCDPCCHGGLGGGG